MFGMGSIVYIVVAERRVARERRRLRRVVGQLEPSEPAPSTSGPLERSPTGVTPATPPSGLLDDRLRSALIQVAVDDLPFSLAVHRARRFGASRTEVERAAGSLRESQLLRFDEPLTDDTRIRLR
jgi:hypothetical protein